MTYRRCSPGNSCRTDPRSYSADESQPRLGVLAESDDPAVRSALPYGLSAAIRDAVEAGLNGTAPEQTPLADWTADTTAGVMER